jgi:hypothetical protein
MYRYVTIPGGMPGPLGAAPLALAGSPSYGPDIIKIWADTKAALFTANGAYQNPDGTDRKSPTTGRSVPRISATQAEMYWAYWKGVSRRLLGELQKAGRPTWSLHNAVNSSLARWTTWLAKYSTQRSYRYVSFAAAEELYTLLGRFVNEIDAGVWTGYNTETDWENALESLSWVSKNPLTAIKMSARGAWDTIAEWNAKLTGELGQVWAIMKWGSVALIAAYTYQVATKNKKGSQ